VFTHLRVLENLGTDPIADRLFVNMVKHFAQRSVPTVGLLPVHKPSVEWLRKERTDRIRRWMVLGLFPNWGNAGHDTAYPPESQLDFEATYPGWYNAITWQNWFARADDEYVMDLQQALCPANDGAPQFECGVAYAYAEFGTDKRQDAILKLGVQDAAKVWLNGRLVHESKGRTPGELFDLHSAPVMTKQGRNSLLVKISKTPGPFRFFVDLASTGKEPLGLKWWK
jgi:hypothetical protein